MLPYKRIAIKEDVGRALLVISATLIVMKTTPFETFCAEAAIAILNRDSEALSALRERTHFESADASEYVTLAGTTMEDFNSVEEIDPFGTWIVSASKREIARIRPVLALWIDSWIEAKHSLSQWDKREQFTTAAQKRASYTYQDFFDHKDGRVRIAFYTSKNERPAELAEWLLTLILTGPYARRIGKCERCDRYCRLNRRRRFRCNMQCTRGLSSKLSKRKARATVRKDKDAVIQETIVARQPRKNETERAWKERLLTALRIQEISPKYLTQFLNRHPSLNPFHPPSIKRHPAPTTRFRR